MKMLYLKTSINKTISFMINITFVFTRNLVGLFTNRFNDKLLVLPFFSSFEEMIDQVYRLSWYYPSREKNSIKLYYFNFTFDKKDLKNQSNRPWYMHSKPIILEGIVFKKCKNNLIFKMTTFLNLLVCKKSVIWDESAYNSFTYMVLKKAGILTVVDHKVSSYQSDINYVNLVNDYRSKNSIDEAKEKFSKSFNKTVSALKEKYNKVYIFGRGPSIANSIKMDFSDGVRIVCNQTVRDKTLMDHIKPHFIAACDHAYHYGCSKLADCFRDDLIKYISNKSIYLLLPLDIYPLFIYHFPDLIHKIIAIPYQGREFNLDLINDFRVKGSAGVLHEILFPVATTISKDIKMLGVDGKLKSQNSDRVWTYAKIVDYPENIVESIHASRPGYYKDETKTFNFEKLYQEDLSEIIKIAIESGIKIETLAPSYHLSLKDKYCG